VDSDPDTVSITTDNSPPVADAGPDQTVLVGDTANLDGSGSTDVDGDSLTFSWSLTTPPGSASTLDDPTIVNPTFGVDIPGMYVAQLIVNDGTVDSDPDTVSITTNLPSADLSISKSDSSDPIVAGNTLTYTVRVDNAGPNDAQNVVVTDALPAGVILFSTSGCAQDPNGVPACSLGSIASGGSAQYTISVIVNSGTIGTIQNSASVSSSTTEANPGDETATESTTVIPPAPLDAIPPTAVCQDVTVALAANGQTSITALDVDGGSSDDVGIQSLSVSPNIFSCSSLGANTVTLTVTDTSGNTSACQAVVTVEDPQNACLVDNQVIGGEIIPIEATSLILAGAQSFSWMILVVLSVLGIGLFVVSRKSE